MNDVLVTGAQMARIDLRAIDGGVPGTDLMERAGRGVYEVTRDLIGGLRGRTVSVLCGRGNNGGDGFVAARLAHLDGAKVRCFLVGLIDEVAGDARHHLDRLTLLLNVVDASDSGLIGRVKGALADSDVAVDALLGTGLTGAARPPIGDVIELLASAECVKVAVDVPSGLDADTGRHDGPVASADATATFAAPKLGQLFYPGRELCGRLHLVDIGIPDAAVEAEAVTTSLIGLAGAQGLLPERAPDAHKGDCGRVAVVAGSVGMTGAASLTAMAALRSGAGLVTLGVPESLNDILEVKLTEVMTRPLPEVRSRRCLSLRARGELQALFGTAGSVAIGPGLGTYRETSELVRRLLSDLECPAVLDADGLNAFVGHTDLLRDASVPLVLTPHPGEFSRLTGLSQQRIGEDPIGVATEFAVDLGLTVVLKGAPTVVASADGRTFVNSSGNAGMATGGTGDVLTGLLAGLLAQGLDPVRAACAAVYLHGLAGDLASEWIGEAGLLAGEVLAHVPEADLMVRSGNDSNRYIARRERLL